MWFPRERGTDVQLERRPAVSSLFDQTSGGRAPAGSGRKPWVCYAETVIRFALGEGKRRQLSRSMPVRLDSGAFMSFLPQEWLDNRELAPFLPATSALLPFQTIAGQGQGTLAGDVRTLFANDPRRQTYSFDWLVTPGLNGRGHALLALRDIVEHFFIRAEGSIELGDDGMPLVLPRLELVPRQLWDRVRYRCPVCQIVTWGRAGLHLVCGDNNVRLVLD
jgi:hypothetical protein